MEKNFNLNKPKKKLKLVRVVTDGRVFPWHLEKTVADHCEFFEVVVVGENVAAFSGGCDNVRFVDMPIVPKINIVKDFRALLMLLRFFLVERPDIVHSIMPKAGLLTALSSFFIVPVRVHTFTGQVWQTKSGISRFFLKMLDVLVVSLNTLCFTDSVSQSMFLAENGIVDKNGEALRCLLKGSLGGVDLGKVDLSMKAAWKREIREKYGISKDCLVVGYLARKTRDKGAFVFLDVCERIFEINTDIVFLFVGPDDSNGEVSEYFKRRLGGSDRIFNIGQVENHEKYLAAFDVLCLPSFREGFGSIVIDAAALEVPTVGSFIPGLVDAVVDNETGILFEAGSVSACTDAIATMISDPELLIKMGKNARSRVEQYFDSKLLSNALLLEYEKFSVR